MHKVNADHFNISRRDFLSAAIATVILGPKLISVNPSVVRIHAVEIDNYNNVIPLRRALSWSIKDIKLVPDVGATLQIEQDFKETRKIERFRVKVVSHEFIRC